MNLESQVCSLDLAKRLKELGVKQKSLFYWVSENSIASKQDVYSFIDDEYYCGSPEGIGDVYEIKFVYSAFTSSELLEILPHCFEKNDIEYGIIINKCNRKWWITYDTHSMDNDWYRNEILIEIYDENLCNALAKMLIHLIENKMIGV